MSETWTPPGPTARAHGGTELPGAGAPSRAGSGAGAGACGAGSNGEEVRGRGRSRERARGPDSGFATAEAAVVLPVLTLFAVGLVWALMAAAAQIQCVDAARVGARAAARQDPYATVLAAAGRAAPPGARVTVRREGDLVRVRVDAQTPGPGALTLHLHQEAVALAEDTAGRGAAAGDGGTGKP